ncbi:DUF4145 domain-containing protein [Brevundimonas diminuta]|uniref:DUF4145 domain-containing protein n=1 Tax=Brevundimonas diminuta TaxID=293 RepID=A0A410NVI8_BREDI|nr:DUF4145 domain-containing protein [Brevundimonas diminuta]QAT13873.1 DUF4145 domain-containing protein [Brevundimonas diminuta]QQB88761.1 DUF4145 domain-containing protein [Brevundimonas diminuta]
MSVLVKSCPHCPADFSTFTLVWAGDRGGGRWAAAATCGSCRLPVGLFLVHSHGHSKSPMDHLGSVTPDYVVNGFWPKRPVTNAPQHVPPSVRKRFLEGEDAYHRKSWNAAVAMYRSALDIATKTFEGIPKGTFFKRLEWLHNNHHITPDMWSWADRVRIEGNEALHDPDDFTEDDAKPLRLFTEMFLKYVFELPGEVAAFREDTEEA